LCTLYFTRRWVLRILLVLILMLMCNLHLGETTAQDSGLTARIDWVMLDGFHIESYASGEQPLSELLHPKTWRVRLTGCSSFGENISSLLMRFTWDIDLPSGAVRIEAGELCETIFDFPSQGTFRVKLTITTRYGNTAETTRYITVKNVSFR